MTKNNKYINTNGCLTQEGIIFYLQKKGDNSFQKIIEEHIADCELCRSAVEGYQKLSNPDKIEIINTELKERFSSSRTKSNKRSFPTHYIVNIITAAAAVVIAILIVKNFTNIKYDTEETLYKEELALLSKNEIIRPAPPARKEIATNYRVTEIKPEQQIGEKINHKIEIEEKKNISASNLPSKTPNETIHGYSDKKLTDKSYTEFQITLPIEVDRRGYSFDNNLITASFEKGIALSALPSFRGKGMEGFVEYVSKHIEYPEKARDNVIEGTVEVQFAVDVDGTVKEIEIKKRIHPLLDMEAYRLIKNSPKWIPGFVNGRPAKVYFRFPVNFKVD